LITNFDKHIYNSFLKASRASKNLPFNYRKDFNKLDDVKYVSLKRLSSFFKRFPNISMDDFFSAPYTLYKDENFFPIEYFTTLKATKAYTLFQKNKINQDPDSDEQLNSIKNSLIFIKNFCKESNIDIKNYICNKTNNQHSFLLHLRDHKINYYTLFGFSNFDTVLKSINPDIVKFTINEDLYNKVSFFRTKLYNSKKALNLVTLGLDKITKKS
jgi:hypothetical protein